MADLKNTMRLPLICTRGIVSFPGNDTTIDIGREKSINAVNLAKDNFDEFIVIASQIDPSVDEPTAKDMFTVGVVARISLVSVNKDQSIRLVYTPLDKVNLEEIEITDESYFCEISIKDNKASTPQLKNYVMQIMKLLEDPRNPLGEISQYHSSKITANQSSEQLLYVLANYVNVSHTKKQEMLELDSYEELAQYLISLVGYSKASQKIEKEINDKIREKFEKNQREVILREKLKIVKDELGDVTDSKDEGESIRKILEENPYPQNIKNRVLDELKRYETMPSASPEASVIKNYIDWLLKTPWYQTTEDEQDITKVEAVLNEDHYGLEKIKERILEYLAVKSLTNSLNAPIICFAGPPGVGKTSLGKSIARALNRKFVKVSLGGMRDEAEIRGHRKTYLGAMPGRIIQGMKKVGVINPVFLLDEIDKLGADYKGDPSNALLEVLDPEQNKFFSDNFIEESYDLSNVLFIATANYLENVPEPLRDRLEIIELNSYTEIEKLHIAKEHLIKKAVEDSGLQLNKIEFSDESIYHIIRYYTREAGVRQLGRQLGTICRKIAVQTLKEKRKTKKVVTIKKVKEYLGKEKFDYTKKEEESQIGVVTGLAYTQFGGDILPVEVNYFEGKGGLVLTGNLGNVMKESATIALDYIRANANIYGVEPDFFEKNVIHIHFPEGAVPKDGPSAGVTMTTAIISAIAKYPVKSDVAMTGEITLRGKVLPIGGLREKSIAAHRSGIKTICIPKDNLKNLDEIPAIVKEELKIVPCSTIEDVLKVAVVESVECK